jgi:hypothetical protein
MAIITFEAISAALFGGAGEYATPGLSYRVRLGREQSITLTTDEKFAELDGSITLYPDDTEAAFKAEEKAIGVFGYFAAQSDFEYSFPANYLVQVTVPRAHFDQLVAAARYGRIPSDLSVDVEGMSYDWQPDGSGKKWDNKATDHLSVSSFKYTLPFFVPETTDQHETPLPSEEAMPPTRAQIRAQFDQLVQRIDRQTTAIQSGIRSLFWAVVIVGVVFVWLRWKG